MTEQFTDEIIAKLKHYVYRLIDPRTGSTFYVGKGAGNRVFHHVNGALRASGEEDAADLKSATIQVINRTGLTVQHIIHRHGLSEAAAVEVEAALIDAYPGLTNVQAGYASERGTMHAEQIRRLYGAKPMPQTQTRLLLVDIASSLAEGRSPYDATRYQWKLARDKAEQIEFVLGVDRGVIVGMFKPLRWLDATADNVPGFPAPLPGRLGFLGEPAPEELTRHYVSKRAPERKRGESNPVRYLPRS